MMVVPTRFLGDQGMADWTAALLFLPEHAYPSLPVEVLKELVAETLFEIEFPGRVVGIRCLLDFHMTLEPHLSGVKQVVSMLLHLPCKHGLASLVRPQIVGGNPARAFVAMSAFGPVAECVEDRAVDSVEGWPTTAVTIIRRPAAQDRVEQADEDASGRRSVVPNEAPNLREEPLDALFGRSEAQIPVILADGVTEKVESVCDMGDCGLFWRAREAAFAQELFDEGADCRCQQGRGVASNNEVIRISDRLILAWRPRPFFGKVVCKHRSRPSRARLARTGEMIPPWGVPLSVGWRVYRSRYPAFSHLRRMTLSMGTWVKSQS